MANGAPVLLLTRPRASSEAFLARLEKRLGRQINCLISPIFEIVSHELTQDLDAYATVILSSANAAHELGKVGKLSGRPVRTVGEATAEISSRYGAEAKALGIDADSFILNANELTPPCLHCRGFHTRGDIAERLNEHSIFCEEAVVYEQKECPLSEDVLTSLRAASKIYAPLFSPRSALLLSEQLPDDLDVEVFAISEATASAWHRASTAKIARQPTADQMLEILAAAL